MKDENTIELNFLDHVAIRVKDLKISTAWYKSVLGLKEYKTPEWGDYPIFLLSGKSGIAIFPASLNDPLLDQKSNNVKIDHFAFNVSRQSFENAIKKYESLNLEYHIQDHHYFDSIYTCDPDGHIVELTSIKVNPADFYIHE